MLAQVVGHTLRSIGRHIPPPRLYDAVMLLAILTVIVVSGQVLQLSARQVVLPLDMSPLHLPRAGFHVLEQFPDTARMFRWTN